MSDSFNIEIVSPEKKILKDKADSATIPSFEGEMTILSNHIPLITFLRPGIVKINGNKEVQYFLEEGTIEFSNNNLTILSSTVVEVSSLSKEKISKMIEDGKNQLNQDNLNDKTRYVISHKIDCLSRINI
tara:strand:+ start:694 stop:1083 length:390 start_codon:yes stop_codon:yes gene_type:complete